MENEQYPIFVYGTLIKGLHNYHRYLKGHVIKFEEATASGFELADINGAFPAAVPAPDWEEVHGQIVTVKKSEYDETLKSCDWLEGYSEQGEKYSMYLRRKAIYRTVNGNVGWAWIYIWNEKNSKISKDNRIPNGCWREHTKIKGCPFCEKTAKLA